MSSENMHPLNLHRAADTPAITVAGESSPWSAPAVYSLALLTLIYTLNYVDRQVLSIVLPLVKADLELSDTTLGLVSGVAFVLFYSLLGIPIARIADRSNRRNLLAAGLAFWSAMTILTGFAKSVWQLAAARFLMGAGEATAIAPSTSIVSDMFTGKPRQLALGILTSGTSLSALLFLPIVGWISEHYGWRASFILAGLPGLLIALLLRFTVQEPPRRTDHRAQETLFRTLAFLAKKRSYRYTLLGAAILGISLYASQIWNPTFLVRVHGLSQSEVGVAVGVTRGLAGFLGAIAGGYLAGLLGSRAPRWILLVPGWASVLTFPAQLIFLFSPDLRLSLLGLALSSAFIGAHFGPVYSACQSIAKSSMRTTAVAIYLLFANLIGQIVGPMTVGILNDRWAHAYGSMAIRYSLLLGAVCALAGGGFMIAGAKALENDLQH